MNLTIRCFPLIGKLIQSWDSITLFLSLSYCIGFFFFLLNFSGVVFTQCFRPLLPISYNMSSVIIALLKLLYVIWNGLFSSGLFFLGLRLCLTFLLCLTLLIVFSYWNIFLSHCGDNVLLPRFSQLVDNSFCLLTWLFFPFCVHDFRHPPGSNLLF